MDVNLIEDDWAWAMVEIPGLSSHTTNAFLGAGWEGKGAVCSNCGSHYTEGCMVKGANWALRGDLGMARVSMRRLTKILDVVLDLTFL